MFGHVAGRQRPWRWAILSFLFALAFAWWFAVAGQQVGNDWSILRLGSAVGLGISLLVLVLTIITSGRRRARKDDERRVEGAEMEPEGQPPVEQPEQPATEKRAPTYEEIFGLQFDLDEGGLPRPPEDEGRQGDEAAMMEAEGQPPAEQPPTEERAPTSEEDLQPLDAGLDGAVDQVKALADVESQEHLRRMREEFKARAEEAARRLKQRQAEPDKVASAPDPER